MIVSVGSSVQICKESPMNHFYTNATFGNGIGKFNSLAQEKRATTFFFLKPLNNFLMFHLSLTVRKFP